MNLFKITKLIKVKQERNLMIYGLTALNAFQLMFVIIAAGDIIKISEEILFLTLQAIKKIFHISESRLKKNIWQPVGFPQW